MRLLIAEDEVDLAEALTVFLNGTNLPWTRSTTDWPPVNMRRQPNMTPSFWT